MCGLGLVPQLAGPELAYFELVVAGVGGGVGQAGPVVQQSQDPFVFVLVVGTMGGINWNLRLRWPQKDMFQTSDLIPFLAAR